MLHGERPRQLHERASSSSGAGDPSSASRHVYPDFKTKVHRAWIGLRRYGADSKAAPNLTKDPIASTKKWSKARFHILSVAVSPRGRRRGIGSALRSEGMIEARARDCAFMDAAVAESNSASLGLFTGFGFEILDPAASSIQVKYILG
jgi:GNAT superfamily N-acetyltransferase